VPARTSKANAATVPAALVNRMASIFGPFVGFGVGVVLAAYAIAVGAKNT
jgi:hypothetical protein